MAAQKKILISIPEELLEEVDLLVAKEGITRSEFIRQAMNHMLDEKHTIQMRETMRKGYEEMAGINLEWAELGLEHDMEVLDAYVEKLSECE